MVCGWGCRAKHCMLCSKGSSLKVGSKEVTALCLATSSYFVQLQTSALGSILTPYREALGQEGYGGVQDNR